MKKITRIISLLLIACVMLSSVAFAAKYSDVTEDKAYYNAVSLLSSLDIIKGYEDGTFGPDRDVTRAEFTVMLMRTMGLSNVGSNDLAGMPFTDLATVKDWAASDIRTAFDLKIINGMDATTFAPDQKVTYEQSLKMVVCALGYEPMALDKVGGDRGKIWPNGYMLAATQIELLNGIKVVSEQPAKRWEIARILYNALEVNVMETVGVAGGVRSEIKVGKTFLNDKLRIKYGTGSIIADDKTSVDSAGKIARSGEVLVYEDDTLNTEIYEKGNVSTEGMVGRMVKYYYREDNNFVKTLVFLQDKTKDSSVITIKAEDIDDVTGTYSNGFVVKYYKYVDDRLTTDLRTIASPIVTINGRVANTDEITYETLKPESGSIELMDSNNDGSYDKVNIIAYETYAVKAVNTTDKKVSDLYRTSAQNNSLSIDEDDTQKNVIIKRTDGTSLTLSSIRPWDILSVKESNAVAGKNIMEVIVSSNSISGNITSLDKDAEEVEIAGKMYKFSKYFINYNSVALDTLSVDDGGKFYLDKDGKIAAIDKTESNSGNYGYIKKAVVSKDVAQFAILTQSGSIQTFTGASRIKVDGTSISTARTIVDELIASSEYTSINLDKPDNLPDGSQLVKYTINSSGLISVIDTIAVSKPEDLTVYNMDDPATVDKNEAAEEMTYYSADKEFKNANGSFRIDDNSNIFLVPNDRNTTDYSYKKGTSYFINNKKYFVEPYDTNAGTSSMKIAKAIVLYASDVDAVVNDDTPITVVTDIRSVNNPDGEAANQITAYVIGKGSTVAGDPKTIFTESSNTLSGVKVGDVIRYGITSKGYIKDGTVDIVLSVRDPIVAVNDKSGLLYSANGSVRQDTIGLLKTAQDQMFEVVMANTIADITPQSETESFTANSSTAFFTYTASTDEFEKLSSLDLATIPAYDTDNTSASEIYVYAYNGVVRVVYQIIR